MLRKRHDAAPAGPRSYIEYVQGYLCDYCCDFILRTIEASSERETKGYSNDFTMHGNPSHRKAETVISSAQQGCWVCNHATSNMRRDRRGKLDFKGAGLYLHASTSALDQFQLGMIGTSEWVRRWESFLIKILEVPLPAICPVQLMEGPNSWTWSLHSKEKSRMWLQQCNEEHTECCRVRRRFCTNTYPSRLLELSYISKGFLRLVDGSSLAPSTRYAALSHCWGNAKQSVLLRSRLSDYSNHIPVESLPKTIREAAEACTDLDLNYLWIDSLCIIQDDPNDWAKEAPRMSEVYTNAYVTLAATASWNDNEGMKRPFNPCHALNLVFRVVNTSGKANDYMIQKLQNFQDYVNKAPLNRRAWVLQERSLSSRIIHFAHDQIYWQCPSIFDAQFELTYKSVENPWERWWRSVMKWTGSDPLPGAGHLEDATVSIGDSVKAPEITAIDMWDDLTNQYTDSNLSFSSDRLIAISGLARRMCAITQWPEGDYLAGIWRRGLPRRLLWTSGFLREAGKPNTIPSWSWASVNTHITYDNDVLQRDDEFNVSYDSVKILSAGTVLINDPFGDVSSGVIRLSGNLCKIKIWSDRIANKTNTAKFFIQGKSVSIELYGLERAIFDHIGGWRERFGRMVFFLPIFERTAMPREPWMYRSTPYSTLYGLMLEPTGHKVGQYRRVGRFTIDDEVGHGVVKEALAANDLQDKYFLERDGLDKYVIEIV